MNTTTILNFDLAHLNRWKNYFPNTYWVNYKEETWRDVRNMILLQRPGVDQKVESIYPFLTLRRVGIPILKDGNNLSAANRGVRHPEEEMRYTFSWYELRYNLDIFTAERNSLDELCIELCDTFLRNPNINIETEDENQKILSSNLIYQNITDNSDLSGAEESMRIFRATIEYTSDAQIIRKFKHLRIDDPIIEIVRRPQ